MNVKVLIPYRFRAGFYYEGKLIMNEYVVKVFAVTNSTDGDTNDVAFSRINRFIYNELNNTIFINQHETEACEKYIAAGLDITTLPFEPGDQLIGIMLWYKLSAIVEDRFIIAEVELSSEFGEGIIYIHNQDDTIENVNLPEWWNTSDLVHYDVDLVGTDKVLSISPSIWADLDLEWPEDLVEEETVSETGNVVVFADFKNPDDKK